MELAPQFTITVNLKAENAGYQLSAVEAGGKFKYVSDEKGVITSKPGCCVCPASNQPP